MHDHPWVNVSVVLSGRYREHFHDGTSVVRKPGHIVFRGARTLHRIELLSEAGANPLPDRSAGAGVGIYDAARVGAARTL